jgi:hypothetical protein
VRRFFEALRRLLGNIAELDARTAVRETPRTPPK